MAEISDKVREAWQRLQNDWPKHQNVTSKEIMAMYDKWQVYDDDMVTLGYQGANSVIRILKTLNLPKDTYILDVGCGTGLAGVELNAGGYHNVDGHDGSSLLIGYAKRKNVYKNTHCFLLGDNIELPIPDGTYDVVIAAGVLCPGHLTPTAFVNLFRLVKPGGYFGHSTRSAHLKHRQLSEFTDLVNSMVSHGHIEKVVETTFRAMYENASTDLNLEGTVQFFRKLK